MAYLIAALALAAWLVLAWLIGSIMHLTGASLSVVRISLALLGIVCVAFFFWFRLRKRKQTDSGDGAGGDEIDLLFRNAAAKLHQAGGLSRLPAIVVTGESGSTKTSVVMNSGLEPELLAGQVHQDGSVVPTRNANIWYGGGAVFVETAGSLLQDAPKWARLVGHLCPSMLRSTFAKSGQTPRVALLCFDIECFLKPGGIEASVAQARSLRERLGEISRQLGIQLPVYVVFTRMDRVPFFTEYVRNFSNEEAAQVLGATLPLRSSTPDGLYGEQEGARLNAAFDELFQSLAGARIEFLGRENDPPTLPAVYEFPREFRKLRTALTGFLLDLCRPSQLAVGPFLRGFYFTGVRPIVVNEPRPAAPVFTEPAAREAASGATRMFHVGSGAVPQAASAAPARASRRVPQWVFLGHLFRDVILADRTALGASEHRTQAGLWRRVLLSAAALAGLFLIVAFTVSWSRNRALEHDTRAAAEGIASAESTGLNLPSTDALRRLDRLRQSVETLDAYRREGPPLSLRWGLYIGDDLYPRARRVYFDKFRQLLFAQTQARMLDNLRSLPAVPGPEYAPTYDTLKAYLITTSNHDKSTRLFLAPALLDRWSAGRDVDPDRLQLARKQFEFYAGELTAANPYSSENDTLAITKARGYLSQFEGMERVYAAMLADASKGNQPLNFNHKFPGAAEVVLENHEVAGAFTKGGWDFMKKAIGSPERYFAGEQWVLGDQSAAHFDAAKLGQALRNRYDADFVREWRAYMKAAAVVRYATLPDAAKKLNVLAGNQSPLLALFALASQNTGVDDPVVSGAFQPIQAVVPPGTVDRFIAPPNQPYMGALLNLQASIEQIANQPGGPADDAAGPVLANASSAKVITRQIAQGFKPDPEGHVDTQVEKLMEDPIAQVEGLLRVLGPAELNAKGAGLCGQTRPLFAKYPFNPNAAAQASIADFNAIFRRPDGAIWSFYEANLQKLLQRQGSQYMANPSAAVHVRPSFLAFLNQAAAISDAVYAGGAQDPHFLYTLKAVPTEGIQSVGLEIDGQTLSYNGGAPAAKQFTWQASTAREARASVKFGSGPDLVWSNDQGPWAVFRFFDKADRWQPAESGFSLEWTIRIGKDPVTLPSGKPLTVRFDLDTAGMPPIFQRGYLSHAVCVAEIAQ